MKKRSIVIFILLLAIAMAFSACSNETEAIKLPLSTIDTSSFKDGSSGFDDIVPYLSANGYSISWSDEFDSAKLDESNWAYETARGNNGWGNNEVQYYSRNEKEVSVSNGNLIIKANYPDGVNDTREKQWYSGRIITRRRMQFKYGYVEARLKLPEGLGIWPAFWLLGSDPDGNINWPYTGEFDIMEYSPSNPYYNGRVIYKAYSTLHTQTNHGTGLSLGEYDFKSEEGATGDYHRFGMLWTADYIEVYYDGKFIGRQEKPIAANTARWPFNDYEAFIILNLAIGGNLGGTGYDDYRDKGFSYLVDYVRLYQCDLDSIHEF